MLMHACLHASLAPQQNGAIIMQRRRARREKENLRVSSQTRFCIASLFEEGRGGSDRAYLRYPKWMGQWRRDSFQKILSVGDEVNGERSGLLPGFFAREREMWGGGGRERVVCSFGTNDGF